MHRLFTVSLHDSWRSVFGRMENLFHVSTQELSLLTRLSHLHAKITVIMLISDLVARIRATRDPNTLEVRDDFLNELYKYALESVLAICFNKVCVFVRFCCCCCFHRYCGFYREISRIFVATSLTFAKGLYH